MENQEMGQSLEALKARQKEIADRIIQLDAAGTKDEEWNKLHNEHEAITAQIEDLPNADELKHAA